VSHASLSSKRKIKEKRKENQYKIRKRKEKKNKIVSVQVFHNIVMQTCWNKLGLNLCVVPPIGHMVTISENSLVKSYEMRSKACCH